ncbi:heavy-metal-associated domain-containing protein [Clostridium fallax]|uniref:Copper chaperone n=1 Tax=Clostridium fallax TaxID=1533 RepID=A0A1M4VCC5_9CLOT|nr:cation transporter [Clostridium fallax]SHE66518.1 copper chaperone [Clostridium fallax]SQB05789.1 copper-transporting P-type ATPase [Clostridium fallax]
MKKTIIIEGMSCMHCVNSVKGALESLKGIDKIINIEKGKAIIEGSVSDEVLKETIEDLGFDVKKII